MWYVVTSCKIPCITINCFEPIFQSWKSKVPMDKGDCYFNARDVDLTLYQRYFNHGVNWFALAKCVKKYLWKNDILVKL